MRPLHPRDGAPVPLFDRLVDEDPGARLEAVPKRVLDKAGLIASVEREIATLLNTRAPEPEAVLDARERSAVDYGLADFSHYFTHDLEDADRLARTVARTVAAFEPRLAKVAVTVERLDRQHRRLQVTIKGEVRVGRVVEPVAFPVTVQALGGS